MMSHDDADQALDALSSEFIAEIKDDLAGLEPTLLAMEEKGRQTGDDLIHQAFRFVHSIKGGAGFINFQELSDLGHVMENVMMRIREKTLTIDADIVDALLAGFDKMKLMADQVGSHRICDYAGEKASLEAILKPAPPKSADPADIPEPVDPGDPVESAEPDIVETLETSTARPSGSDDRMLHPMGPGTVFQGRSFPVNGKKLAAALESQKFIYAVHIRFEIDLKARNKPVSAMMADMESIGDILFTDYGPALENNGSPGFFCVIATILDLPLLSQVLEIGKTQITLVDRQFTDCDLLMKGFAVKPAHGVFAGGSDLSPTSKTHPDMEATDPLSSLPAEPSGFGLPNSRTIRINVDLVSGLMNRAGELVLARNRLRPFMAEHAGGDRLASGIMQHLDMVTADIQEAVMQMRLQPVIDLAGKYKRVVRDMARKLSKKVDFILDGADVEVDRTILEKLANPVIHLIRNAIDHGIESPEERVRNNKPETGLIRIRASQKGGHVHITVSDDGSGIDPRLILSKAYEKGLITEDQIDRLTDREKINLIFLPGFTTSDTVTDISGRGVGMDVVKTDVESLRGHIEIDSIQGEGTRVHLIIPLTLSIVPSLIVRSGDSRFAIPQAGIREILYLEEGAIHNQVETIAGAEVLRLRGKLFPVLRLRNLLDIRTFRVEPSTGEKNPERRRAIADRRKRSASLDEEEKRNRKKDRREVRWDQTYVVVLKLGENRFGLCVDDLQDIEEVVVTPLPEYLSHLKVYAGMSILGDGSVIMVLDAPGLASISHLRFDSIHAETAGERREREERRRLDDLKRNLIVFQSGPGEYFAMELKHLSRLSTVKPSEIHRTGRLKHAGQKGRAVPVFSMDELGPASCCDYQAGELFILYPRQGPGRVGLLASGIVDTLETGLPVEKDASCPEIVMGKVFLDDMMVQVLDPEKLAARIEQVMMTSTGVGSGREHIDC